MKVVCFLLLGLAAPVLRVAAFAAEPKKASPFGMLESIASTLQQSFSVGSNGNKKGPEDQRRKKLKDELLKFCRSSGKARSSRESVEQLIEPLAEISPTQAAASSPLLQKNWRLEWTTEKEINFFDDWGISSDVSQNIEGSLLENLIEFRRGGYLGVKGSLNIPDQAGKRTNFIFTTATLDLGKWGSFQLPPVGEGWFDTVYLDEELRIDTNSRNDILICTPASE